MPESILQGENNIHEFDVALAGGGVWGIGHVGALTVAEQRGYRCVNVAGTSAGSLVAAFLAAGYSAAEMRGIMNGLDYRRFASEKRIESLLPVKFVNLWFRGGIHSANYVETFTREHLSAKGIQQFGQLIRKGMEHEPKESLYRYKLVVIALDISTGRILRLPQDAHSYGLDPDEVDVARAVRMSASIPFFFRPALLQHINGKLCRVVDGGAVSNLPVSIFDVEGREPLRPTIGFRLVNEVPRLGQDPEVFMKPTKNALEIALALIGTMKSAHDDLYLEDHDFVRTICIPAHGISSTKFDLSKQEAEQLFQSGQEAASEFFDTWDFAAYKAAYRSGRPRLSRREQLHATMDLALQSAQAVPR